MSDNGPQYASCEFTKFAREWGFEHVTLSPTYPQSNGLAERTVQTIKQLMKKAKEEKKDVYLSLLELRNTPVHGTMSPAQQLCRGACDHPFPDSKGKRYFEICHENLPQKIDA